MAAILQPFFCLAEDRELDFLAKCDIMKEQAILFQGGDKDERK